MTHYRWVFNYLQCRPDHFSRQLSWCLSILLLWKIFSRSTQISISCNLSPLSFALWEHRKMSDPFFVVIFFICLNTNILPSELAWKLRKVSKFLKSPKCKQSLIMECHSSKYKIMCYSNKKKIPSKDNCLKCETRGAQITRIILSSVWFRLILQGTEIYRIYWGLRGVTCMCHKLHTNIR